MSGSCSASGQVESGHSPSPTVGVSFAALNWDDRGGAHPMGKQATVFFPNGYGASIICGPMSYGGDRGLYELAVLKGDANHWRLTYETPITDDVEGDLSPEDVDRLLAQIAALPAVSQ